MHPDGALPSSYDPAHPPDAGQAGSVPRLQPFPDSIFAFFVLSLSKKQPG